MRIAQPCEAGGWTSKLDEAIDGFLKSVDDVTTLFKRSLVSSERGRGER
jgi:hypothetical protein